MPILLKSDPIFTVNTSELGSFNINGFSNKVAARLLKYLENFIKSEPEDAIKYFLTLVAYHDQADDKKEKKFITKEEAKRIYRDDLVNFSVEYLKYIRLTYKHGEKKEDLTAILGGSDEIEKLHKILIIKVEEHKKFNEIIKKKINSITGNHINTIALTRKYKELDGIYNAAKQTFDHINKYQDLYGYSFAQIAKDLKIRDDLIKDCVTSLYLPDTSIISSLKSEFDRIKEQYSSNQIYNLLDQTNISMEALALEQSSIAKISEEASSINKWMKEIDSIKHLSSLEETLKLATRGHIDSIVQTSLLAQKNLLSLDFERLRNSIIYENNDLTRAIASFTNLTGEYNNLINSFNTKKFDILDFPPFVSGLPPIEMLTSSELVNTISRDETEDYVEKDDLFKNEIKEDVESSLEELLAYIDPKIKILWRGAKKALSSNNPDKKRHVVVSLREMLTHILHGISPDEELKKWTSDPNHFHNGRPTRKARLLFVCREINNGPFGQFMQIDVESHIKFIDLFQRGTHEIDIKYTNQQVRALLVRTEALARFLLITWKDTL